MWLRRWQEEAPETAQKNRPRRWMRKIRLLSRNKKRTEETRGAKSPFFFFFLAVLELELRAYTLSHYTSPFFCEGFFQDRVSNCLLGLASNRDPLDLCLLSR
jgi:hypothetical protein